MWFRLTHFQCCSMFLSPPHPSLPPFLHSAFQPQVFSASTNFPPRNSISHISLLNADLCQRFKILQNLLSLHNNSPDNSCGLDIHKKGPWVHRARFSLKDILAVHRYVGENPLQKACWPFTRGPCWHRT